MVAGWLSAADPALEIELVTVRTSGDERPGGARAPVVDDKARFVKEIEEALLAGEADVGVHSAKDVPGVLPDGLVIAGVPERADARDALCGPFASLAELPSGAHVGTSSLRRRAQVLAAREDLVVDELRGNVDTRLRRLAEGRYDAIVLATAGLRRLGLDAGEPLDPALMTPAPGQGCLALEVRADDGRAVALASSLTHEPSRVALATERALVEALGATCHTPAGAHAFFDDEALVVDAFAGLPDGSQWVRDRLAGDAAAPEALGRACAERLLAAGAGSLLDAAEAAGVR